MPRRPHALVVAALVPAVAAVLAGCSTPHEVKVESAPASAASPTASAPSGSATTAPSGSATTAPSRSSPAASPAGTSATTTAGTPVRSIVVLGDSVPAGEASDGPAFPELVRQGLAPANPGVALVDLPDSGATSADLLTQVRTDAATRTALAKADLVLVMSGANDLYPALTTRMSSGSCDAACEKPTLAAMSSRLGSVLHEVATQSAAPGRRIVVLDYWNVFQDGTVGLKAMGAATMHWADDITRQANAIICADARAAGAICVDTYAPFKADGAKDPTALLAPDGDHPNGAGHAVIAREVLRALGATG